MLQAGVASLRLFSGAFVLVRPPRALLCGSCLILLRTDSGWEFDWGGTSVKR